MSIVYDAINDSLLAEKGLSIVKGSEEKAFNALRGIQEQNGYASSEEYFNYLRPDEDRWMEDNFGSDPKAKHSGTGKRHGWKYRTYMPAKYWNSRTVIGAAIDKGIDVTGKGKSALQKETTGAVAGETTDTVSGNLIKFMKSWMKCKDYLRSMSPEEQADATKFIEYHPL